MIGSGAFQYLIDGVQRCIASDTFDDADPTELATQLWALGHGGVTLQLARLLSPEQAASCLVGALLNLFASFGAGADAARRSIETAFARRRN